MQSNRVLPKAASLNMVFPNGDQQAEELLQAQAHVWNHIFSYINSSSLKCAVELNIPDIIHKHGKPITISELINALPINNAKSSCVPRLMRILTHSGFFIMSENDEKEEEGFLLTNASRLLLTDEPLSMKPFLLAQLSPVFTQPWDFLSQWFQNDQSTPFETAHGKTAWEYFEQEPSLQHLFIEAMASDAKLVTSVVIRDCEKVFDGINSLVDVGGGTGMVGKGIADAFQDLQCTVFDLPHVVDGLQGTNNLSYVGGDMFDSIPTADAVLLKWILHDWNDEECVKILKKCKEAIPRKEKGGKVIIIEMIMDTHKGDHESIETQLFFDMLMMVMAKGKERTQEDWVKLFFDAGFTHYNIIPILGSRSLIEVYP